MQGIELYYPLEKLCYRLFSKKGFILMWKKKTDLCSINALYIYRAKTKQIAKMLPVFPKKGLGIAM